MFVIHIVILKLMCFVITMKYPNHLMFNKNIFQKIKMIVKNV